MRSFVWVLFFTIACLMGCSSSVNLGRDDLVRIMHNSESEYTLLVYQSPTGKLRKVLRKKGVCELLLIEAEDGDVWLKERGADMRLLTEAHTILVEAQLHALIHVQQKPASVEDADV